MTTQHAGFFQHLDKQRGEYKITAIEQQKNLFILLK